MAERQLFIVNEGVVTIHPKRKNPTNPNLRNGAGTAVPRSVTAPSSAASNKITIESAQAPPLRPERAFRYGRVFNIKGSHRRVESLTELGLAMHRDSGDPASDSFSALPSGYTYLGQLITHDITFDKTFGIVDGELESAQIKQGRSPSLELDSLYGMGPLSESSRHLYEDDRIRFKIGKTTPTLFGNANFELPNDLPRDTSNPKNPRKALLADSRNEKNLALAQTHLSFLKFHNAVVKDLTEKGFVGKELFVEARKEVIRHYQWIILHDYLPQITDPAVLADVLSNNSGYFKPSVDKELYLPLEFAFAAFRFGHTMVRDKYEWNRVFQTPDPEAPDSGGIPRRDGARLHQLFALTAENGTLQGAQTLPTNWVIDWTRFYDFSGFKGVNNNSKSNRAHKIGTSLSLALKNIPGFPRDVPVESRSVAVLDLQMGALLELPSGQQVAKIMEKNYGVKPLTSDEIVSGPNNDANKVLTAYNLQLNTPLWYYILREAELINNGNKLGPMGSRIVAETIVSAIEESEYSILQDSEWEPHYGRTSSSQYGMANLLYFINELNPLGYEKKAKGTPVPAVSKPKPKRNVAPSA